MIKFIFFLLFVVYMVWKIIRLRKEKEKRDFYMAIGIGLISSYLLVAQVMDLPTVNLLHDVETFTYPIGTWLQKSMGITFLMN